MRARLWISAIAGATCATMACGGGTPSPVSPSGSTASIQSSASTIGSTATTIRADAMSSCNPDTQAPVIHSVSATPDALWPPNHKMHSITVHVNVTDNCDASPSTKITAVHSNEPVNSTGDGNTSPDWLVTGPLTLELRAERKGNGNGRVYTITVTSTDDAGNRSTKSTTVTVAHDQGR